MIVMVRASRRFLVVLCVECFIFRHVLSLMITKRTQTQPRHVLSAASKGFGKVPSIEYTHTPDESKTTKKLIDFLSSFKSEGLDRTQIGFSKTGNNMRGLYAMKNFKKGDILCKIPSDMALALSDPQFGGDDVPTIAHAGRNLLMMYINNPQNQKMWSPYLDVLPSKDSYFDPTPDFYTDDEIDQLEFPRAVQAAKQRKKDIETVAAEDGMNLDELQFATWIVSSRAFNIQITAPEDGGAEKDEMGRVIAKPQQSLRVLIPFIDMTNHCSDSPNCELHLIDPEKDDAWFAIRALRPIPVGREITIAYGTGVDSSVELLLNHGFVPTENKVDEIMIKRGGKDCIDSVDGWKTTLEDDLKELETATGNMRDILALRVKLKQAYQS